MNPKIEKINQEIQKQQARIEQSQARIKELEQQRTELENTEILRSDFINNFKFNLVFRISHKKYFSMQVRYDVVAITGDENHITWHRNAFMYQGNAHCF